METDSTNDLQDSSADREPTEAEASLEWAREVERLQTELAASRRRVDELARAYQALDQDREDFKRRLTRERERLLEVEKGEAALMVLETMDELDRSLEAASAEAGSPLAEGVRLIRAGLLKRLQSAGVERLELQGTAFDPNLAEAVDMEVTPDPEEDQRIIQEVRAGYALRERVLRPARVRVARYFPPVQA